MNKHSITKFIFVVIILLLVFYIYQHQTGSMSPQAKANLAVAENPSLISAVKQYPKYWPPVYPVVLWIFAHFCLPARYFNLLCFYLLLALVWFFFRRYVTNIHPALPVLLLALTNSIYVNTYLQVSESLFVLLVFFIMILLLQYQSTPTVYKAFLLGVFSSAAVLTRFLGLFWIVPITIVYMWFSLVERSSREKTFHLTAYFSILAVIVIPFLILLKRFTGSFSGTDRFAARNLPESISHWNELTGFFINVKFLAKTTFIDFFSFSRSASHKVINESLLLPSEYAALLFVLFTMIFLIFIAAHKYFNRSHSHKIYLRTILFSPKTLPFYFTIIYIFSIIIIWSISNNDPIYTRFMYPSYIFIILSVFSLYSWIKDKDAPVWHKIPFYLLYLFYLSINLIKIISNLTK